MRISLRNVLINGALLLGSVVFFFGAIEIFLRVSGFERGSPTPPLLMQPNPNPNINYELKPNVNVKAYRATVTTNKFGFRSPDIDPKKPSIAVLGDSVTFGYGLEDDETIPARLSRLFENKYNVLNTGVPGYNLIQETETYRVKIEQLSPRLLILIFFPNDLQEMEPSVMGANGILRPKGQADTVQACNPINDGILGYLPGRCWLDLHSALYRSTRKFIVARSGKIRQAKEESENRTLPFADNIPEGNLERYEVTLAKLDASLPKDLPRLFVIWPDRGLHFLIRPRLKQIAERHGFKVFDMYEVFGNHAETLGWDTVHPSNKTASEGAEVIKAALEYYQLLPQT